MAGLNRRLRAAAAAAAAEGMCARVAVQRALREADWCSVSVSSSPRPIAASAASNSSAMISASEMFSSLNLR